MQRIFLTFVLCALGFSAHASPPGGRLTTSGACVMRTDSTAVASIGYVPCALGVHPTVSVFNGSTVADYSIQSSPTDTTGLVLALGSNWSANSIFEAYATLSGGVPVMCSSPFGAVATQLYDGLKTNAAPMTCRDSNATTLSVPTNQGTRLGLFLTGALAGTIDFRFGGSGAGGMPALASIWNDYNRTQGVFNVNDTNVPWHVSVTSTYQPLDGSTNNRITFVTGDNSEPIDVSLGLPIQSTSGGVMIGVGLNVTNAIDPRCQWGQQGGLSGVTQEVVAICPLYPTVGINFIQAIQWSGSTGPTFYGNSGAQQQQGLIAKWWW